MMIVQLTLIMFSSCVVVVFQRLFPTFLLSIVGKIKNINVCFMVVKPRRVILIQFELICTDIFRCLFSSVLHVIWFMICESPYDGE